MEKIREKNKQVRAKLQWCEGPHIPPSKDQSGQEELSSCNEDDEQPCTDGSTPGRKSGHDRGMFVHGTLLFPLAIWRQQGRNPYEEFKRVA